MKTAFVFFVLAIAVYLLGAMEITGIPAEFGRAIVVACLVPAVIGVSASVIGKDRPDDVL